MHAARKGQIGALRRLTACGAKVHLEALPGKTALMEAVAADQQIACEVLLQCSTESDHECQTGQTAAMLATELHHWLVLGSLVQVTTPCWGRYVYQSQGTREHILGVGTNRRGLASIFPGLEPIAGD
eukprot:3894518-Pyramimonas_sp.AAC.1